MRCTNTNIRPCHWPLLDNTRSLINILTLLKEYSSSSGHSGRTAVLSTSSLAPSVDLRSFPSRLVTWVCRNAREVQLDVTSLMWDGLLCCDVTTRPDSDHVRLIRLQWQRSRRGLCTLPRNLLQIAHTMHACSAGVPLLWF